MQILSEYEEMDVDKQVRLERDAIAGKAPPKLFGRFMPSVRRSQVPAVQLLGYMSFATLLHV